MFRPFSPPSLTLSAWWRVAPTLVWLAVGVGCSRGSSAASAASGEKPLVGGLGTQLASGSGADLRLTPDGKFAAFLASPEKPKLEGVPVQMVLGDLTVVPIAGGTPRHVGDSVTNMPGGYLFTPDSRWVLYLAGYNASNQQGELLAAELSSSAAPVTLGKAVTYMLPSGDSKWIGFIEGGVLKVGPIPAGPFVSVAGDVSTAQFSPDSTYLLYKRSIAAGSALLYAPIGKWKEAKKLADLVGDYSISPDSRRVAFNHHTDNVRATFDLFVASVPAMKPMLVAAQAGRFAFSSDSKWLARTEGNGPGKLGDLFVGPAEGGAGFKVEEKVEDQTYGTNFQFSPDSTAIACIELSNARDRQNRLGTLSVAQLPEGKAKRVGFHVPNFSWGADGKAIAFLAHVFKPVFSVDLFLYRWGGEQAEKVAVGAYGYYEFAADNGSLLYRTHCVREGRACDLYAYDLKATKANPALLVEALYSFKRAIQGPRVLITYARTDSQLYDVAVLNRTTHQQKTLDQQISLPALFADPDGTQVVYLLSERARAGAYVAKQLP